MMLKRFESHFNVTEPFEACETKCPQCYMLRPDTNDHIKSQGIKTKLVPWIQALVPDVPGRWIEPFLGTGVVAFNSGFQRALLADTNPYVIRFYQQIQEGAIQPSRVRAYLEEEGEMLKQLRRVYE